LLITILEIRATMLSSVKKRKLNGSDVDFKKKKKQKSAPVPEPATVSEPEQSSSSEAEAEPKAQPEEAAAKTFQDLVRNLTLFHQTSLT
jgi:hypothetical protein